MYINQTNSSSVTPLPLDDTITIIIPVLNEAKTLAQTLSAIKPAAHLEIIVVDGGSDDGTVDIAQDLGVKVVSTQSGRAHQMNAGAMIARGNILLFLHGDTQLPVGFDRFVQTALAQPHVVAGAFKLRINRSTLALRIIEWGVDLRSRILQMPYGDQAIFLRSKIFYQVGCFPKLPIMEDFELIRRLRRLGKIEIVPASVLTSKRRWQELGVCKTTMINQITIAAYLLNVSPDQLARWYRQQKKAL